MPVFVDVIKNFEKKGEYKTIQVGSKCHDKCPYLRKAEGDMIQTHREESSTEAETGVLWSKARGTYKHQKQENTKKGFSSGLCREYGPADPLIFDSGLLFSVDLCCLNQISLFQFTWQPWESNTCELRFT